LKTLLIATDITLSAFYSKRSSNELSRRHSTLTKQMRSDQITFKFEPLVWQPLLAQDPRTFQPLGSAEDITLGGPRFTGFSHVAAKSRRYDPFTNVKQTWLRRVPYPVQSLGRCSREVGGLVERLPAGPHMTTPPNILRAVPG
jgi:hypothetical protein